MNYMIALALIVISAPLAARVGCMDYSYHGNRCAGDECCQKDYKRLHFVQCDCPCERYQQQDKYGRCMRCGHLHESMPEY